MADRSDLEKITGKLADVLEIGKGFKSIKLAGGGFTLLNDFSFASEVVLENAENSNETKIIKAKVAGKVVREVAYTISIRQAFAIAGAAGLEVAAIGGGNPLLAIVIGFRQ